MHEVSALIDEARRLGLPIVLLTDVAETKLARLADIVVAIPRGRSGQVALHGGTFVAIEALLLGLTTLNAPVAIRALDRLNTLRFAVSGQSRPTVGSTQSSA